MPSIPASLARSRLSNRGQIYLSGAMQYASDGTLGSSWRKSCSATLRSMDYVSLDIADMDIEYTKEHDTVGDVVCQVSDSHDENQMLLMKANVREHFIRADLNLIQYHSDAMIVKYDEGVRRGAGTISECQFAYNHSVPVFLVNEYDTFEAVPGWLAALTTKMFPTWEDLYDYLDRLPYGILIADEYGNRRAGSKYLCSLCGTAEEKKKTHFVSKVTPMLCKHCVETTKVALEQRSSRYGFFQHYMEERNITPRVNNR